MAEHCVCLPFVVKPVVNGVGLLQILLQIRKTIRHEKREKATMGLQGENPKTLVALSKSWFFREDRSNEKDTVRLPWQYLPQSDGGVYYEGLGCQGRPQR